MLKYSQFNAATSEITSHRTRAHTCITVCVHTQTACTVFSTQVTRPKPHDEVTWAGACGW